MNYEEKLSTNHDLTFETAKREFEVNGVEFDIEKYPVLGITQIKNEVFTNLALLVSDQCTHTIKVAVFSDEERTVFRDSKEFSGSVFKQFEDTVHYLSLCNKTNSEIKGYVRYDRNDYPEEALREALLNAIVHRDYSFSGSIIINITDNNMEFISIGGLMPGLSFDDIRSGISQPRNKHLSEMFHRLRLIEGYGTGIRRIFSLYKNCNRKPKIEVTTNTFKMILPNMNTDYAMPETKVLSVEENTSQYKASINPRMQKILEYIKVNGCINDEEIGRLLEIKKTASFTIAKQMRDKGLIEALGRGETRRYVLTKQNNQVY